MDPKTADQLAAEAVALAETWQNRANQLLTLEERGIQKQMKRLLTHPRDKVVLTKLIDQSFRAHDPGRVADQVNNLLRQYGVPDFFSSVEKLLAQMFMNVGKYFPSISVPKMIGRMRHDSSRAIIPGEPEVLHAHLKKRKEQGVRMNINHLGEAVLGEDEAAYRLKTYLADLADPEIEYISVKISTIYSQISSLAFEHTIGILVDRLSSLYGAAQSHVYERRDGSRVPKFVNLDMEEYRDLEITYAAFVRTLDNPAFKHLCAGIVLQAYLPDSFAMQQKLTRWAKQRVAGGGGPIIVRIVKGANMEMELLQAALNNWPLAPYNNKLAVDANYKRMVEYGMQPENIRAVRLGIASHNLFELAYAFQVARHNGVSDLFTVEMLEGMADHVRRAIAGSDHDVLLYAPVATREQFINAIAYLIRRLDENTARENFLRHSFDLKTDSPEWAFLKQQFVDSLGFRDRVGTRTHRTQNRGTETFPEKWGTFHTGEFVNESDTDWALPANRQWAERIRERWMQGPEDPPLEIPVVAAGVERFQDRDIIKGFDPSRRPEKVLVARYALADDDDVQKAVETARKDPDGWRRLTLAQRHEALSRVAAEIRKARGDLIGAAAAGTGKVFTESDVEVSEAIDFVEYYPFSAASFEGLRGVRCTGKGIGLVISPWNFPIAIPCGGIAAALAAGNTVLFKPSSDALLPAWILCNCFWRAGISKNTLQFLPCSGSDTGPTLTGHPDVDFIILTGGTDTGLRIWRQRPGIYLAAETGGKNATIVTAMSDRDQAIANVIHSAFSNCGQKCSATSLLILETEVYEDPSFKKQLVDAARSMKTGSAWHFENRLATLIKPPRDKLKKALTELLPGETWALKPENIANNPMLWTPGIKWDVTPGSETHLTEFFGPVLGVMRADSLSHAVELANRTAFGLTSGLESLDPREQEQWKQTLQAGNLYINRGTTGAVVLRQPFGGMKASALGAGIKAGGPNYVAQFMRFEETDYPAADAVSREHFLLRLANEWHLRVEWGDFAEYAEDIRKTVRAIKSYLHWMDREFGVDKDYFHIRGQDNILRYLPVGTVIVRVHASDTLFEILARIAAARISGNHLEVSVAPDVDNTVSRFLDGNDGKRMLGDLKPEVQTDEELIQRLSPSTRIRYATADRVPEKVLSAAVRAGHYISRTPVLMTGRMELLQYFREQALCINYHRYGNLGERALEA